MVLKYLKMPANLSWSDTCSRGKKNIENLFLLHFFSHCSLVWNVFMFP